jgi:hypothetical protein
LKDVNITGNASHLISCKKIRFVFSVSLPILKK